jgi:uncharacterized protein
MEKQMFSPVTINDTSAELAIPNAEQFFRLGMMYSTGESVPLDLVSAHKCFNIAAKYGIKNAIRLRNEVATEMSEVDIVAAQRAARTWLLRH